MDPMKLLDIGTKGVAAKERYKIRLLNLLTFITTTASTVYLICYIYIKAIVPAYINTGAIIFYLTTFLFIKRKLIYPAKIWLFSGFTLHLFVLGTFVFPKNAGTHFYYFSIPPTVFLIFKHKKNIEKFGFSIAACVLFYIRELYEFGQPLLTLTDQMNRTFYLTSLFIIFLGISIVIFLFARDNKEKEKEQDRLIDELQKKLDEIKVLKGFLPICASCKKIRDDKGYWNQIEAYIQAHSEAEFSHGICPECAEKLYPEFYTEE